MTSQPLLAWRRWAVNEPTMRLLAVVQGYIWQPGINEARCNASNSTLNGPAHLPGMLCQRCGFYGTAYPAVDWVPGAGGVAGVAAFWGKVAIHERGLRATRARVVGLLKPERPGVSRITRDLAREYSVPCLPMDQLRDYASEHGRWLLPAGDPERCGERSWATAFHAFMPYRNDERNITWSRSEVEVVCDLAPGHPGPHEGSKPNGDPWAWA